MYTLRHTYMILGSTFGLTRSGVKFANIPRQSPTENSEPLIMKELSTILLNKQGLTNNAVESLVKYKISTLSSTSSTDAKTFRDWLDSKINEFSNKGDSMEAKYYDRLDALYKQVIPDTIAHNQAPAEPATLANTVGASLSGSDAANLSQAQSAENILVKESSDKNRESIVSTTRENARKLSKEISALSDLNNDALIDSSLRDVVNEDALKTAISRLTNGGEEAKMRDVFKNVTGKDVRNFSPDEIKEFQTKLRTSLTMLQYLTGGNAGLYGLLSGNLSPYINGIKKLNPKPEVKIDDVKGLTPKMQNLIGAAATIGLLVVTGGVVVAGHNAESITTESVLKDLDRSTLGKAWDWIRDALTGRRLALTFGKDMMSVSEYKDKVLAFAKDIMQEGGPKSQEAKDILATSTKIATELGLGDDKDAIKKAAIQAYVQNLGNENAGTDWTAKIGLLFIGANRDKINPTILATKYSKFNEIEASLTKKKLTSAELISAGVKIEKTSSGTFNHIIPSEVQFAGDDKKFPVVYPVGIDLANSSKVLDFHFSDKGDGKYVLTTTERNPQPTGINGVVAPVGDTDKTWTTDAVNNLRQAKVYTEKSDKNIPQVLYDVVGHQSAFAKLAKAVSRGDMIAARGELDSLSSKYKKDKKVSAYITQLKADFDKNATSWDTYMSGNSKTRAQENPVYDSVRTKAVIAAEGRLASKTGFPKPSDEGAFRVKGKYEGKQVSEIIPGQEVTSVQFMTPIDEKGSNSLHRASVVDGSFQVSAKSVLVTDSERKNQIVNGLLNSSDTSRGIEKQLKKLNDFLGRNGVTKGIEKDDYTKYLVSGDVSKLGIPGLAVQPGKETRFLEARAKVAGNVCLNCTYAIGYPAFTFEGIKQDIEPVASMDVTAELNAQGVLVSQSEIGLNTLAVASKLATRNTDASRNPQGNSTPGTVDNGTIKPPSGGSTVVTPPQPATPVTAPEIIKPVVPPAGSKPTVK